MRSAEERVTTLRIAASARADIARLAELLHEEPSAALALTVKAAVADKTFMSRLLADAVVPADGGR